jgi:hypothetical protein
MEIFGDCASSGKLIVFAKCFLRSASCVGFLGNFSAVKSLAPTAIAGASSFLELLFTSSIQRECPQLVSQSPSSLLETSPKQVRIAGLHVQHGEASVPVTINDDGNAGCAVGEVGGSRAASSSGKH